MSNLFHRMTGKRRAQRNGEVSPDERQAQFLREHEERMRKVDEAISEVKRSGKHEAEADRPASA